MPKEYRRENFGHPSTGAYITVYQRPGEKVMLDLNFFDGDKTFGDCALLRMILMNAMEQARKWENEG
jgi:hypothetical protein